MHFFGFSGEVLAAIEGPGDLVQIDADAIDFFHEIFVLIGEGFFIGQRMAEDVICQGQILFAGVDEELLFLQIGDAKINTVFFYLSILSGGFPRGQPPLGKTACCFACEQQAYLATNLKPYPVLQ